MTASQSCHQPSAGGRTSEVEEAELRVQETTAISRTPGLGNKRRQDYDGDQKYSLIRSQCRRTIDAVVAQNISWKKKSEPVDA